MLSVGPECVTCQWINILGICTNGLPLLHDNLQPPVIMYGADQRNGDAFGPLRIIFIRMESIAEK